MGVFRVAVFMLAAIEFFPAWAQAQRADTLGPLSVSKLSPATLPQKPKFKTVMPTMARGPVRLTAADYKAMLPRLATLAKVPITSLAAQPVTATNLATPGGVLNVGLVAAPPGGGFQAAGAEWAMSYSPMSFGASVPACIVFDVPPGPATINRVAGFTAPIQGPGTYLITVYVETPLSQVSVSTYSGAPGTAMEFTGPNAIAIQNGKVIVVHEATAPHPKELQVWISPIAGNSYSNLLIYSCDFMRIR